MDKDLIQEYTFRITQANKSEMIVIIYEILLEYIKDAKKNLENDEADAFHDSIRRATNCVRELIASINYDMEISGNLLSLYIFCSKELALSNIHHSSEELVEVESIISKLYMTSKEIAKKDNSAPVMQNTESVYAGFTYGKESLVVNLNSSSSRGYTV